MKEMEESVGQIRQVWNHNVDYEFCLIRQMVKNCRFASFDTEFPGTIYKSQTHPRELSPQKRYALMKANVDALKLIQFGLTLSDEDAGSSITWEFNFRDFNPHRDPCSPDSVRLLHSQGINFYHTMVWGIDSRHFANLLWSSGLICNNRYISWITFHGASDFGYLIKILTQRRLPESIDEFSKLVRWYFGDKVLDIKYLIKFCDNLYGGLERVGVSLNVERGIGQSHQAGSDSLLTWRVYHKIKKNFFKLDGGIRHAGVVFGLHEN